MSEVGGGGAVWVRAQGARGDAVPAVRTRGPEGATSEGCVMSESGWDIPRRARIDRWVPAEQAIQDAVEAVEALPADERLTKAVTLLGEARHAVADYVDGVAAYDVYLASTRQERDGGARGEGAAMSEESPERQALRRLRDGVLAQSQREIGRAHV